MTEPFEYGPHFNKTKPQPKREPEHYFGAAGHNAMDARLVARYGTEGRRTFNAIPTTPADPEFTQKFRSAEGKDIGLRGSQGTLFRVDKSQRTPESRQPRGYSPERIRAVDKRFGFSKEAEFRLHPPFPGDTHTPRYAGNPDAAHVLRTIARSTVPMHHLNKLDTIISGHKFDDHSTRGQYDKLDDVEGSFHSILVGEGEAQSATAIHEIGHHVGRKRFPNYGQSYPYMSGQSEGHAEHYAEEHAREPGYKRKPAKEFRKKQEPDREAYPWIHHMRLGLTNGGSDFRRGYREEREPEAIKKRSKEMDAGVNRTFHGYQPGLEGWNAATRNFKYSDEDKLPGEK